MNKSTLVSKLSVNPTLFEGQLTQIKVDILYLKLKLLTTAYHVTMLNLNCENWTSFNYDDWKCTFVDSLTECTGPPNCVHY